MKISLISLGCAKNLVDSEVMLGKLKAAGVSITPNPDEADLVIVNTCGFIKDAKLESIDAILELIEKGKRVVAVGCLAQRYKEELKKEIPELEAVFGTESWDELINYLRLPNRKAYRLLTTPRSYAYLKIAEGCNRLCSFCAIPAIRGRHRSKPLNELVEEARRLAEQGVKELCVISQDTTYYGRDLRNADLLELLKKLEKVEGIKWIRLLYLYPTEVTDELLAFINDSEKVLPYFDVPLQHVSDRVLKSMRRGYDGRYARKLVEKILSRVEGAVIRTAFIVGYPEEDEKAFNELLSFVKDGYFHWLGVFTYSPEEGTPAYGLGDPVPEEEKLRRKELLLEAQRPVTRKKNEAFLGKELEVIVDGLDQELGLVPVGRTYFQAPEVDGLTYLETEQTLNTGQLVKARVEQVSDYDLGARVGEFKLFAQEVEP
ncbi:MAG: 30S ribosomal protein S12 methylthiotransferase RimO [Aquificae bacterium]|nr:30S ribosomal protein S12 methylthiotransferase RimO [Aquificota bacterium]